MSQIEAIYKRGVFEPVDAVSLPENQRVRLSVQPIAPLNAQAWLAEVQGFQRQIVAERGYFPDSAADIAADRARDE